MKGFKNFLMRGDVIVVAVGLVVALAFSGLITAFTTNIINPIVSSFQAANRSAWVSNSARPTTLRLLSISAPLSLRSFISSSSSRLSTSSSWCLTSTSRPAAARWSSATRHRSRPARTAYPAICPPPPANAKYCGTDQPSTSPAAV